MTGIIKKTATEFVGLVVATNWREMRDGNDGLSPEKKRILHEIVSVAGFKRVEVVFGKLYRKYHRRDGRVGNSYCVNQLCHHKVMDKKKVNHRATGWLEEALHSVYNNQHKNHDQLIKELVDQIDSMV